MLKRLLYQVYERRSAYSEFYFCDAHWPAFRKVDFLRAIRSYGQRQRRFGK